MSTPAQVANRYNETSFLSMLKSSFPPGRLFAKMFDTESLMHKFLLVFAKELYRIETTITTFFNESIPGRSDDDSLLLDWGLEFAIADDGIADGLPESTRRLYCQNKKTVRCSSPSAAFYIAYFAAFGLYITIDEVVDLGTVFRVGDSLTPSVTRVGSRLKSISAYHYWEADLSSTGTAAPIIQRIIMKIKPAHTAVTFTMP